VKYIVLNQDEFDEDRPGIPSDMTRGVLTSIVSKVGGEGEISLHGLDEGGPTYIVMMENPRQIEVLVNYLTRRSIWHEVHDQMPNDGPRRPRDMTQGVIFFRLTRQQIRPGAVRGAVHGIAAILDEQFEFTLHADFFQDPDEQAAYWVGFNDVSAGQMFAMFLRTQDVPITHRDSLYDGRRPTGLPRINYHATQQAAERVEAPAPQPGRRGQRHRPAAAPAQQDEGRGFAVVAEMVRRRLSRGDGPSWKAKMEKRLQERFGLTSRERPRRGDDGS
jgi:hypothetical protein